MAYNTETKILFWNLTDHPVCAAKELREIFLLAQIRPSWPGGACRIA
jgi:hypothetical protein